MDIQYAEGVFGVAIDSIIVSEDSLLERLFSGHFSEIMSIQYTDTPHAIAEQILALQFAIRAASHTPPTDDQILQIFDRAFLIYDQILHLKQDSDIFPVCIPLIRDTHGLSHIHAALVGVVRWILTSTMPLMQRIQHPSYANTLLTLNTEPLIKAIYEYGSFRGHSVHEAFMDHQQAIRLLLGKSIRQEAITKRDMYRLIGTTSELYQEITMLLGIVL